MLLKSRTLMQYDNPVLAVTALGPGREQSHLAAASLGPFPITMYLGLSSWAPQISQKKASPVPMALSMES